MRHRSFGYTSLLAAGLAAAVGVAVSAQEWKTKSPSAAEWTAMAKLPDFNGVWEAGRAPAATPPGGQAGRGAAAPAAGRTGGGATPQPGGRAGGAPGGGRAAGAAAGPQL